LVLNKQQQDIFEKHWVQLQQAVPDVTSISVGFSGGADSTFLLFAIHQTLPASLSLNAIHFNHGISPHAEKWQLHCEAICQKLGIPLQVVALRFNTLKNFEAEARKKRINYIEHALAPDHVYAMGHHANDQVETFFMKLFRGAGLAGLAGMRLLAKYKHFFMWRPLLSFKKNEIIKSLFDQNIDWIEDESNASTDYYRNQLRLKTLPPIYDEVAHLETRVLATTEVIQANLDVLNDYLDADLANLSKSTYFLSTLELSKRSSSHVSLMIHRFLDGLRLGVTFSQIKALSEAVLTKQYIEVWLKQKVVIVENNSLRVFEKYTETSFCIDLSTLKPDVELYQWFLPGGLGKIVAKKCLFTPQVKSWVSLSVMANAQLVPRPLGQVVHPIGRNHSISLKKYLQERRVPKYLRKILPVVICSKQKHILCVPSLLTNKCDDDNSEKLGFELTWSYLD
jgi:tRNA(Ile)-lysidine synthase